MMRFFFLLVFSSLVFAENCEELLQLGSKFKVPNMDAFDLEKIQHYGEGVLTDETVYDFSGNQLLIQWNDFDSFDESMSWTRTFFSDSVLSKSSYPSSHWNEEANASEDILFETVQVDFFDPADSLIHTIKRWERKYRLEEETPFEESLTQIQVLHSENQIQLKDEQGVLETHFVENDTLFELKRDSALDGVTEQRVPNLYKTYFDGVNCLKVGVNDSIVYFGEERIDSTYTYGKGFEEGKLFIAKYIYGEGGATPVFDWVVGGEKEQAFIISPQGKVLYRGDVKTLQVLKQKMFGRGILVVE